MPIAHLWALIVWGSRPPIAAIEDPKRGLRAALAANFCSLRSTATVSDYTAGEDFTGAGAVLNGSWRAKLNRLRSSKGVRPKDGLVDWAFCNNPDFSESRGNSVIAFCHYVAPASSRSRLVPVFSSIWPVPSEGTAKPVGCC
jgi:hypothetical protein